MKKDKYFGKVFPKYTTQLMNLANQNAQGTRPKNIGQLSEMIQNISPKDLKTWEEWYRKNHSDKFPIAVNKIKKMMANLKNAINQIDEKMIFEWVEDLVIFKTSSGLIIQEQILKHLS